MLEKQSHSSRRLRVLFIATTIVPACSLAWLGRHMVQQDRGMESDRDQAANSAADVMKRVLAEAEDRLTTFNSTPASSTGALGEGAALVVFVNDGILNRAGSRFLITRLYRRRRHSSPRSLLRRCAPFR